MSMYFSPTNWYSVYHKVQPINETQVWNGWTTNRCRHNKTKHFRIGNSFTTQQWRHWTRFINECMEFHRYPGINIQFPSWRSLQSLMIRIWLSVRYLYTVPKKAVFQFFFTIKKRKSFSFSCKQCEINITGRLFWCLRQIISFSV